MYDDWNHIALYHTHDDDYTTTLFTDAQNPVMLNEAKLSRPKTRLRPKPLDRGRDRGQKDKTEIKAEAKVKGKTTKVTKTLWVKQFFVVNKAKAPQPRPGRGQNYGLETTSASKTLHVWDCLNHTALYYTYDDSNHTAIQSHTYDYDITHHRQKTANVPRSKILSEGNAKWQRRCCVT